MKLRLDAALRWARALDAAAVSPPAPSAPTASELELLRAGRDVGASGAAPRAFDRGPALDAVLAVEPTPPRQPPRGVLERALEVHAGRAGAGPEERRMIALVAELLALEVDASARAGAARG